MQLQEQNQTKTRTPETGSPREEKRASWWKYIKPYLAYFLIGPVCMIVEVIGEVLMPKCLASVIDNAAANGWGYALQMSGYMVALALLMIAGGIGGAYFATKAAVNFAGDVRTDIYGKIQAFSFANIDRFSTGSLVTRLTNDVTQVQNMIVMLLRMALRAPGMLIGALILSIILRPKLAVVMAVTIPLMILSIAGLVLAGYKKFQLMQTRIDGLNVNVQENVTNMRVVKSFVREDFEEKKFRDSNRNLKNTAISATKILLLLSPVMSFFMNATIIAVLWFGSRMIYQDGMLVGDLSAFLTYVHQILMSLMMVTFLFVMLARAIASGKRIKEVLNEQVSLTDENASKKDLKVEKGEIEFRDVTFRYYKHSEDLVLDHISLTIPAGAVVGIIGSTGCGKTTLVSMIPRLYDPDGGCVLVDGVDVRDYSLKNLRDGVGMVLQNNVLFSGSIADNLRWGNEDATDEEIRAAAESAQAHGFVSSFNGGYEYDLGQGGKNVSGGQKQRLCIARALLKKPKVLILDDSTSAVDTATEARIRNAFYNELADTTKIVIAQRISSVQDADMIVVMNEGAVTGVGTHEELLKTNLEYREIYESQTGIRSGREGA
ncbi:MAG: ABC transporter ATP-binding protein [Clostridia bacterium]|nr:ABC transporter ATP-binding protein [Clostridia bacterium]